MRYGIFSDVHSNLEALDAVIEAYSRESIDQYLCAGDVIGYAANPRECIEKVKSIVPVCAAGNHDWAAVNLLSLDYFTPVASEAILWTRRCLDQVHRSFLESLQLVFENNDLTLVHSSLDNPQDFNYMYNGYSASRSFSLLKTNTCFVGHSHIPCVFIKDKNENIVYNNSCEIIIEPGNKYIVNVGSVGQPRDNNPDASFCIYDTNARTIHIKRARYDVKQARQKIIEAGLPRFLGDRLLAGV